MMEAYSRGKLGNNALPVCPEEKQNIAEFDGRRALSLP